ncbi:hypothetical protein VD0002_g9594 [Verticillium dahliae]|nr:hypothetical protein VD0003_g10034 [Verticillium dahliae]PNH57930.1 hypothetical protein VD0002_g9594 [Verticillium dahliae]PNH61147.1 hypothetical protein VD0001_g9751 [Verticillium dahliae]
MYMPNRAPSGGLWTHRFTSLHLTLFLTRTTIFSALVFPSTAGEIAGRLTISGLGGFSLIRALFCLLPA